MKIEMNTKLSRKVKVEVEWRHLTHARNVLDNLNGKMNLGEEFWETKELKEQLIQICKIMNQECDAIMDRYNISDD
jgi:hypothetical protein